MNQKIWTNNLLEILKKYNINNPKSIAIYQEALTHKSYANEKFLKFNQQRLEFLGDSAIGWIVSNYLYNLRQKINEGEMTRAKAGMVTEKTLAKVCKEIGLDKLIYIGNGMKTENLSNKILEDSFEAFIGAIVCDQGIKKVVNLINQTLIYYYENDLVNSEKDPKTKFQEIIQSKSGSTDEIYYKNSSKDKDNDKIIELYYNGVLYGKGRASTVKEAEQKAASAALEKNSLEWGK